MFIISLFILLHQINILFKSVNILIMNNILSPIYAELKKTLVHCYNYDAFEKDDRQFNRNSICVANNA